MANRTRIAFHVDHVVGDGESNAIELEVDHAPFVFAPCNRKFDEKRLYRPDEIRVTAIEVMAGDDGHAPTGDLEILKAQINDNGRLSVKFSRALGLDEGVILHGWFYFNV